MRTNLLKLFVSCSLFLSPALAQSPTHLLLRNPSLSKTQIVFEYASDLWIVARSGGDAMPWYFRKAGLGPLVGIGGYPPLLDGGHVTAPRWAFYGLIGVDQDPKLVREGHHPQLERAVKFALEMLEKDPPETYKRPPYPDYHPKLSTGEAGR